ncbi:hypothetical protein AB0C02_31010 [Micromonospora sp. NPDC048999]|uniref:hypothetical protein n=1 Tax=Micromonospora sp. NPDC048999 TaxID=3155391 RepID=UPI0033D39C5E
MRLPNFRRSRFPGDRSAIAMHTVIRGELPALVVARSDDDLWLVGDGINEPDSAEIMDLVHLAHLVELDRTLLELADLERAQQADRETLGSPWVRSPFQWLDEEE